VRYNSCAAAVVAAVLVSSTVFAAETATVFGKVTDPSGAALPGATVTAHNVDTGVARTVTTGADGTYRVPALAPGRYEFITELAGFATTKRTGVNLSLGAEAQLDVPLALKTVTDEITVTADAPVVETSNASVQTVVNREQIDLLPLIGRDFQDLARLSAGAVVTSGQGTAFTGSRGRSNQFLIDGVDNSEDISGFRRQEYNLEAVQEFQVLVNNYKAEYGRASGGVVNVLTRSGTNQYHGSAFFLFRNQDMIARDPFLKAGDPKDPFKRKQWGANLGGPILKDRTHFYLSFEYQDRLTNSTTTRPFPPPGATISPAVQQVLSQNEVPPFPDTSQGTQVRLVRPEFVRYPKFSARVDHQLSNAQSLTFRFNYEYDKEPSGKGGTIFDANGATSNFRTIYGSLAHKWVRSSTQLNEAYLQIGQSKGDFFVSSPGLVDVFVDEFSSGTAYLGGPTNFPQGRTDHVYQFIDNYTIHKPDWGGSHVFKIGGDAKIFRSASFFDSNFRGSYFFTTVANFLAGRPRRFTQNSGDSTLDRPNNIFGFYAQDDWRVHPRLTLNLGLRYDYENGKTEALKDVTPGAAACDLTHACGEAGPGISGDKNNFAPRLGFIWDVKGDHKTAVHGGLGLYYDQIILNIQGNARFTPPKVNSVQIENPPFPDPLAGGSRTTIRPSISVIDPGLVTPKNLNTSLGVRREVTPNVGVDATLVWNRGYDHVVIVNTNSIDPTTGARPNPNFTNVSFYTNQGDIKYRGFLLEVKRRMANRYSWGVSYTLAKAENTSETIFTGIQVPRDIHRSFGPSDEDRRHVIEANFVARLPWNFDVAGVFEYRSPRPMDIFAGGRDLNGDGITGDWVDGYSRNQRNGHEQFDMPLDEANRLRGLFGLSPIASFARDPRFVNVDLNIQKRIKLGGSRALRLTGEVFNVANHPNFAQPSQSITSSLFGQATAIDVNRGARPRSIQFTAQFDF